MKILAIFVLAGCCLMGTSFGQNKKQGYFPSFDSTRVYYEVAGKGYPVLVIHGFMNSGAGCDAIPSG